MSIPIISTHHPDSASKPDLFKLTKCKEEVDLAANTIRKLFAKGLPRYTLGKLVFVSRSELEEFIKSGKAK